MHTITDLKEKYPGAISWSFGDNAELADDLAARVISGLKTASCGSLSSFQSEDSAPTIGSYSIVLNSRDEPVCVIRTIAMYIVRFCDMTEAFAMKEGEGDLSLAYWREAHQEFFTREGSYSETMELVAEEFELVEVL